MNSAAKIMLFSLNHQEKNKNSASYQRNTRNLRNPKPSRSKSASSANWKSAAEGKAKSAWPYSQWPHRSKKTVGASHPKSLYLYFVNLYEKSCHIRIQNLIRNRNQIRNISNQLFPSIHNDTRSMRSQYNLTYHIIFLSLCFLSS